MKFTTRRIAFAGILAAVYAAVTIATSSFAYGQIQFRIAEALTVLCCFTPAAIPGMLVGCMAANLASYVSTWDFLIGSFATLLACIMTWAMSRNLDAKRWKIWFVPLPTILCNAVIVGAEIAFFFDDRSFWTAYSLNALSVGAGEAAVMYLVGVPLLFWLLSNTGMSRTLRSI